MVIRALFTECYILCGHHISSKATEIFYSTGILEPDILIYIPLL